jgi:hypothetical protein
VTIAPNGVNEFDFPPRPLDRHVQDGDVQASTHRTVTMQRLMHEVELQHVLEQKERTRVISATVVFSSDTCPG